MNSSEKTIFIIISTILRGIGHLPISWRKGLANGLGRLWHNIDKTHRTRARQNMAMVFQEKTPVEINQMALGVFQQWTQMIFELGWGFQVNQQNMYDYIELEGWEHMVRAHRKKKGILVLTGHMGNWELMPPIFKTKRIPMNVVNRPLDFKPLDYFMSSSRTRYGINLIAVRNAVGKITDKLARREMVGILIDQNANHQNGVFIDFMKTEACASQGMARLALLSDAPVVPLFLVRSEGRYKMICYPEIPLVKSGHELNDIEANTYRYNEAIARVIRDYPTQWLWIHDRWKTKRSCPWPRDAS